MTLSTTKELRALVSSDWHLGGMTSLLGSTSVSTQLHEIEKVYKYAVVHGIEYLFVPGDLFDTPVVSYDDVLSLTLLLLRYKDSVKTYYIAGNHDFSEKGRTSLDIIKAFADNGLIPNLHVYLEPCLLDIDGIPVAFLPYPCLNACDPNLGKDAKQGYLNFCHVDYPGAIGDNGHSLKIRKGQETYQHPSLDFTISGHIHLHQTLPTSRFMYTGSLYQKTFAEKLPKGFIEILVSIDDTNHVRVKKRMIKSVASWQLSDIRITSADTDFKKLSDKIKQNPKTKYRLVIDAADGKDDTPDIHVPTDFMAKHTNIVKMVSRDNKATMSHYEKLLSGVNQSTSNNADSNSDALKVDVTFGLVEFLKSRMHNNSDIKRAKELVASALQQVRSIE